MRVVLTLLIMSTGAFYLCWHRGGRTYWKYFESSHFSNVNDSLKKSSIRCTDKELYYKGEDKYH